MFVLELAYKQEGQFLKGENIHKHIVPEIRMIGNNNASPTYRNMISNYM